VVQSDLPGFLAAILADVPVTAENLIAGKLSLPARALDLIVEANYGRQGKGLGGGVNEAHTILQHLRFTLKEQYHCPARPAHRQWFVTLVQHKHRIIYHAQDFFLHELPHFT